MAPSIYNEAGKIWKQLATDTQEDPEAFELEVGKKLLQLFHVGDYYYYIFNVPKAQFDFISAEIKDVLGYDPSIVTIPFFLSLIHPDDQAYFLNFENTLTEFLQGMPEEDAMQYKIRYDYRVRKADGEYIRILQQFVTIQYDRSKGIARTFCIHTDITHIKQEGTPVLSFIGMNGKPSYIDVTPKEVYRTEKLGLSKREKHILQLIVQGLNNAQISKLLFISELTVKTHRKNILRKTRCLNTAQLVLNAIKRGWV